MARLIRYNGKTEQVEVPLTLTAFQIHVGGSIEFIELESGDLLVVNEEINRRAQDFAHFSNPAATVIAGLPVLGDVVICSPSEVA
jgi:hypothetical protein